jgi:hypothetical protein
VCADNHDGFLDGIYTTKAHETLLDYLNPKLFDPATMHVIRAKIRSKGVAVIRNAFRPEFAEAVYQELVDATAREDFAEHVTRGVDFSFACHIHNIWSPEDFTPLMHAMNEMMNAHASKELMTELTGRKCGGGTLPSAARFLPGDHSFPHSDYQGGRTVAWVWHLTKNWQSGWGGECFISCRDFFAYLLLRVY